MFAGARRSFVRIDRVYKLANSCLPSSEPAVLFKGYKEYHGLSFVKISMDLHKKQKFVWKQVSTQATPTTSLSSHEDDGKFQVESSGLEMEVVTDESSKVGVQVNVSTSKVEDNAKNVETTRKRVDILSTGGSGRDGGSRTSAVNEAGKYSVSVEVAPSLVGFVIGKGGSTQKEIERETGVKIIFPSSRKDSSVVIKGDSMECVNKASERIQVILEEAVKSPTFDYSHFISLPLAIYPELVDKLLKFQSSILEGGDSSKNKNQVGESDGDSDEGRADGNLLEKGDDVSDKLKVEDKNDQVKVEINKIPLVSYPSKSSNSTTLSDLGIDKSIFIKPKTFHLTVLMLKLWNKERVAAATAVLERIFPKVIDALENRPISVRLKGLECMKGSLAKARVLYAPVEEIDGEGRLLRACQVIIDAYVEAGLVLEKDARHTLKLHATVMNARHRKGKIRAKRFESFDARNIMEQYGTEEWGEYLIREAHLSQRFYFDESGYYHCCGSIPFPKQNQVD